MNFKQKYFRNLSSKIALLPMAIISLTVFVGCIIYSFIFSLTNSKLMPVFDYV
jgi:ABC-type multidrug transport system permease subunit